MGAELGRVHAENVSPRGSRAEGDGRRQRGGQAGVSGIRAALPMTGAARSARSRPAARRRRVSARLRRRPRRRRRPRAHRRAARGSRRLRPARARRATGRRRRGRTGAASRPWRGPDGDPGSVCSPGSVGMPSITAATGSAAIAPAASWTAVTASGSRPSSSRGWTAMNAALPATEASTSRSPAPDTPPPPVPATSATPASASANPNQADRPADPRPAMVVKSATSAGTAPTISAAWLTLVRSMPAFWSTITRPKPSAPAATMPGVNAAPAACAMTASRGAAIAKRATVSQPGPSVSSAILDSGTVRPHSTPAAVRASRAELRGLRFFTRLLSAISLENLS